MSGTARKSSKQEPTEARSVPEPSPPAPVPWNIQMYSLSVSTGLDKIRLKDADLISLLLQKHLVKSTGKFHL